MASKTVPGHFVVDGSNIATEGRSAPSLAQLNEAVLAFMEDYPGAIITVVVDATFGHRIDPKEVKAFDEAVANNELVAPPAGAIGRGDAFVLSIANKANAGILSNDSFQEFHGQYDWLFDEGRLIGGKPVPNVGWVFVPRSPVRGPKSRRAVREAQGDLQAEKLRTATRVRRKATEAEHAAAAGQQSGAPLPSPADLRERTAAIVASGTAPAPKDYVNEIGAFLDFVSHHPVGTTIEGVVEKYSSHGAYARVGDDPATAVLVYVPLRLMDDPPPPGARKAMQMGSTQELVVVAFVPERRSIDAARPHVAAKALPEGIEITPLGATPPSKPARGRKRAEPDAPPAETAPETTTDPAADDAAADTAPAKPRRRGRKQAETETATLETDATQAADVPAEPAGSEPAQGAADARPTGRGRSRRQRSTETAADTAAADTAAATSDTPPHSEPPSSGATARSRSRRAPTAEPDTAAAPEPAGDDTPAPEPAPSTGRGRSRRSRQEPVGEAVPTEPTPATDPVAESPAESPARSSRGTRPPTDAELSGRTRSRQRRVEKAAAAAATSAPEAAAPSDAASAAEPTRKATARKRAARAATAEQPVEAAVVEPAPVKKAATRAAAGKPAAKQTAAKKSAAKKTPAKKAAVHDTTAGETSEQAPATASAKPARKAAAKRATKQSAATQTATDTTGTGG